jgi:hypothetical protein
MKTYFIIITGAAAVLIALLGGVAVRQNSQLAGAANLLSTEEARDSELQKKVESAQARIDQLEAENQHGPLVGSIVGFGINASPLVYLLSYQIHKKVYGEKSRRCCFKFTKRETFGPG